MLNLETLMFSKLFRFEIFLSFVTNELVKLLEKLFDKL